MSNDSKNQEMYISIIGKKFECVLNKPLLLLGIISFIAILIRIYFFPVGLPVVLDGLTYFWYAMDMSILGEFPSSYLNTNNGWPSFLSIFFSIYHSENFLDYMTLQRIVTILLSVLTIVPVYLLCRRFFDKQISVIGASLFVLDPRIIDNSLLGITEPLFILLGTSSLVLFLNKDVKMVYLSFVFAALFALVRYEGLLLIIPLSIMFIIRFRKEKIPKIVFSYISVLTIFILVLLPIAYMRIQTTGDDGLISHISANSAYVSTISQKDDGARNLIDFFSRGVVNLVKYLGWVTIPIFVFFLPFGIFKFFKKLDYKKTTVILVSIFFLVPAFYAYSRDIQETRYLYVLFPIFCVLSCFIIEKLNKKIIKPNILAGILISGIILGSLMFTDIKKTDHEFEMELFNISKETVKNVNVVNDYYPKTKYFDSAILVDIPFPILRADMPNDVKAIKTTNFDSLDDFLNFGKEKNLTHLMIDENENSPFLRDIFYNESKYPHLIKIYDSRENGFSYYLKVFRIDYTEFDSLKNK